MAAQSAKISLMVIIFSFSFIIFAPSRLVFSYENRVLSTSPTPSPSSDKLLLELKKFVAKCVGNLSKNCGEEIRNDLLEIENMSAYCCKQLVQMGKICHMGMVGLAATTSVNKEESSTISSNSARVYNKCERIINIIASSPH
ncbi:protein DOWN-REGULATED IN DIF1 11-like [Apium graveolens]|uniref:protein DOWN-REGULATED IN DIF1 11-like n=1 Tax=Apium graveolens TaxID=4045 RepID=UPI003D7AF02B